MPMNPLAETIAKIRKRLGESQNQFGQRLKIQQTTVSKYELGTIVPGAFVLMQLADLALPAEKRVFAEEIGRQFGAMESEAEKAAVRMFNKAAAWMADPRNAPLVDRVTRKLGEEMPDTTTKNPITEIQALWV